MNIDELKHWGILNLKWGIRRFQNPDGLLTEEGRKRYGVGPEKPFRIESDAETWSDFQEDISQIEIIKSYIYLRVAQLFDPQASSAVNDSRNNLINELECGSSFPRKAMLFSVIINHDRIVFIDIVLCGELSFSAERNMIYPIFLLEQSASTRNFDRIDIFKSRGF